jgi:hypothetical protein
MGVLGGLAGDGRLMGQRDKGSTDYTDFHRLRLVRWVCWAGLREMAARWGSGIKGPQITQICAINGEADYA